MIPARNPSFRRHAGGFTLIELMVVVAIVAILATVALPAFGGYFQRVRASAALSALSIYHLQMEQRYNDERHYGRGQCVVPAPRTEHFQFECSADASGQHFTARAVGINSLRGYIYTIDHAGERRTVEHPKGVPSHACWSLRGVLCDA